MPVVYPATVIDISNNKMVLTLKCAYSLVGVIFLLRTFQKEICLIYLEYYSILLFCIPSIYLQIV